MYTISVDELEWVELEHYDKTPQNIPCRFRLKPKTYSCTLQFRLSPDWEGLTLHLENIKITQISVNSNIATTDNKLQGRSRDKSIVNS